MRRVFHLLFFCLLPLETVAMGLGANISASVENWGEDGEYERRTVASAAPLLFDTDVSSAHRSAYRFTIGLEESGSTEFGVDYSGYMMTHTWGFPLHTSKRKKLWLGPELKMAYYTKFVEGYYDDVWDTDVVTAEGKGHVFGVGLGVRCGINFLLGRYFSLGIDFGNRYMQYRGSYRLKDESSSTVRSKERVKGDATVMSGGISIIFFFKEP